MASEPIFECSWFGTKVSVYPDRIEERKPLGLGKRSIGIKQVASVEVSPLLGTAKVETTGGREYKSSTLGAERTYRPLRTLYEGSLEARIDSKIK